MIGQSVGVETGCCVVEAARSWVEVRHAGVSGVEVVAGIVVGDVGVGAAVGVVDDVAVQGDGALVGADAAGSVGGAVVDQCAVRHGDRVGGREAVEVRGAPTPYAWLSENVLFRIAIDAPVVETPPPVVARLPENVLREMVSAVPPLPRSPPPCP